MRSTGEVMGIDSDFGKAVAKAEMADGVAPAVIPVG
jgi:carbamoyl-phosphate synthase large subunit